MGQLDNFWLSVLTVHSETFPYAYFPLWVPIHVTFEFPEVSLIYFHCYCSGGFLFLFLGHTQGLPGFLHLGVIPDSTQGILFDAKDRT